MYSLSKEFIFFSHYDKSCNKMFNLTNVGLGICVTEYSDLFPNLMIKYEPILAFMPLRRNIPAWQEKSEIIPAWRGKVGIVLLLDNPI